MTKMTKKVQKRHIKRWKGMLRQLRSINVLEENEYFSITNRLNKLLADFKL